MKVKKFNNYFFIYLSLLFLFGIFWLYIKHLVGNDSTISEWFINYQGGFKDGQLNGKGIMNYPDGRRYEGEYKNNKRDGYGIMNYQAVGLYQEGSRYEGEWKNDKRDGQGVMTYLDDGRRLEGEFKEDVFIGG